MTVLQRCTDKSCGNHISDDHCRCTSVYRLEHGRCSGHYHVIDEPKQQIMPVPVITSDTFRANCRRSGGKWKSSSRVRVWR